MKKIPFILLLILSLKTLGSIVPIGQENLEYYRQAFPSAAYMEILPIEDPLTIGGSNNEYARIFDQNKIQLGIIRDVFTDVGCDSYCSPLDFSLSFGTGENYLRLLTFGPLTKFGHIEFDSGDYLKLHEILLERPSSYNGIIDPKDMIDSYTGATKIELKNDVVEHAAFTCLRISNYLKQTLESLAGNQ